LINGLLSLFFPAPCASCGRYIKDFKYLYVCPECYNRIRLLDGVVCKTCMKPMNAEFMTECRDCQEGKKHFTHVAAAGVYSGALKELIHLTKFYERKKIAKLLADFIFDYVMDTAIKWADVLVPVPLSKKAMSERGYNQTALVAAELSKRTGVQYADAVIKVRETEPQNKLERKDRLKNLKDAFKVQLPVNGKKVLVVDDVYTTGATMNEMAKTLIAAGAKEVRGIVAARSV
jgi:ComF family protein